jgi:hypothetical protein
MIGENLLRSAFMAASVLLLAQSTSFGQQETSDVSVGLLKKDFPSLWERFGKRAEQQRADYVIAVDVSGSMKRFRDNVVSSASDFLEALPDGDYVSLISFGTEAAISGVPTTVNSSTRSSLRQALAAMQFNERDTDLEAMSKLILDELNRPGGSDLKFVFVFTDFDHDPPRARRGLENWEALAERFRREQAGRNVDFYGMKLQLAPNSGRDLPRIQEVFPAVQVIPVNPATLGGWFERRKAEILRDRLRHIVALAARDQLPQLSARGEANGITLGLSGGAANEIVRGIEITGVEFAYESPFGHMRTQALPFELTTDVAAEKLLATTTAGPYFDRPIGPPSLTLEAKWLFAGDAAEIDKLGIKLPATPSALSVSGSIQPPGTLAMRATGSALEAYFDSKIDGLSLRIDSLSLPSVDGVVRVHDLPLSVPAAVWTAIGEVPIAGWVSKSFDAGDVSGRAAFVTTADPSASPGDFDLEVPGWLGTGRYALWQIVTAASALVMALLYAAFAYRPGRKFRGKIVMTPPGQDIRLTTVSSLTIAADSKDKNLSKVLTAIPAGLRFTLGTAGSLLHPLGGRKFLQGEVGTAQLLYKTGRKEHNMTLKPRQRFFLPSNLRDFQVKSGAWTARWMRSAR